MIKHLAILAPGLLGASVARAARARGRAERITVWARRPEVRAALAGQEWVDTVADTPEAAVAHASLVVLAAPVDKIIELDRLTAPHLATGAIVTDVGSVKGPICAAAAAVARPRGACFVGSHPMAGGAQTGWEHARADLFEGRVTFVTPPAGASSAHRDAIAPATHAPSPEAVRVVEEFWRSLGSTVVSADPAGHDEIVANISHLPQAVATTLANTLAHRDGQWRHLAGNGLRDTTRIAASDATMWVEIFQHNRDAVLAALLRHEAELAAFRHALEQSDWTEIRARLERGKAWRDGFRP